MKKRSLEPTSRNFYTILEELEEQKVALQDLENYVSELEHRVEMMQDALSEAGYVRVAAGGEEIWVPSD